MLQHHGSEALNMKVGLLRICNKPHQKLCSRRCHRHVHQDSFVVQVAVRQLCTAPAVPFETPYDPHEIPSSSTIVELRKNTSEVKYKSAYHNTSLITCILNCFFFFFLHVSLQENDWPVS